MSEFREMVSLMDDLNRILKPRGFVIVENPERLGVELIAQHPENHPNPHPDAHPDVSADHPKNIPAEHPEQRPAVSPLRQRLRKALQNH